ncbi:LysR family transcriptional regulator [Thalassotalea sp. M1531]|uniref:LysR family transcriptional regulator n=1 Tax=Thalassotalea algicola TaxID=2716224 RepID=A0A7Y0LAH4_9GAMM|nr:LysR family transcriptional regulator [Thalassotalea algicola]NMP30091.1 LysR family transcriptional regulator [Thalassotalea algicola]
MYSREHKKIERLFLFGEVANQLSFTKAAKTLGMSKGYLSAQIKQLEQELALPLLVRSTRSVRLTASGRDIVRQIASMRRSLLSVERYARDDQSEVTGRLRITAPIQFTNGVLIELCKQFNQRYPKISFEIDSSYTNYDLMADDFDLAFRATNQPPKNLIAKKIMSYRHICCASPTYLAEFGRPTTPEELIQYQCLPSLDHTIWQFSTGNITVKGWLSANDNSVLKQQGIDGLGIVRLPSYYVEKAINNKLLIPILTDFELRGQSIYLLQPQLIRPAQKVVTFSQFVQQKIALPD